MKKNKLQYSMFMLDFDTYMKIIKLAKKNGKKAGDNMQEEFKTIAKKYPHKFNFLGITNKDIDLLTGNLREKGLKIFNPKEYQRKKQ